MIVRYIGWTEAISMFVGKASPHRIGDAARHTDDHRACADPLRHHVTLDPIFAGMMPYMLIVVACMVFMYWRPGMTLWLPNYLYGN